VPGRRVCLRFLPCEQEQDGQARKRKHKRRNQCINFKQIPHDLPPAKRKRDSAQPQYAKRKRDSAQPQYLTANQADARIRNQRDPSDQRHNEKKEEGNQCVVHFVTSER
jgi:hypothetical protein